ncbi:hypothetical protein [Arthrobacter sp. H35-D1]|uniref:hypothetical protein n=1 Tax=Arthrobacter sp. H35-D1 TaxID=3046202 RepID=UPI0024B8D391|nr:hypothetical protein [Arthrobacter sp. H35-D1]MDJ0312826.1 hypothetical protein [Arthrobacter sp. H35-D1]
MPTPRTQLCSSTFWTVRRPNSTLTEGHFVLRLNDPSLAFGPDSAADLLRCYGHLRGALLELGGATAAHLYCALNWQPIGDALGEPTAETSTPTLHAFFTMPGSRTAASVLALPAHQRVPETNTEELDERLRRWHGGRVAVTTQTGPDHALEQPSATEPGQSGMSELPGQQVGWESRAFHIEPATPAPGMPFRGGHWTGVPRQPVASLERTNPSALLELAQGMNILATHAQPAFAGVTVWVCDDWASPAPPTFHIFGRRHGDAPQQLAGFVTGGGLDVPLPALWRGKSDGPSPIVEK